MLAASTSMPSSPSLSRSPFERDPEQQRVLARCDGVDLPFIFWAVDYREYLWVGELKPESPSR